MPSVDPPSTTMISLNSERSIAGTTCRSPSTSFKVGMTKANVSCLVDMVGSLSAVGFFADKAASTSWLIGYIVLFRELGDASCAVRRLASVFSDLRRSGPSHE